MMGLSWGEFGVADLINHQHTWGGVAAEALANQTRIGRRVQRLRQLGEGGEQSGIASGERFHGKRQREMRFPNARRSQKNHVGCRLDKGESSQLPKQPLREIGLKSKVKSLQRLDRWKTGCRHAALC